MDCDFASYEALKSIAQARKSCRTFSSRPLDDDILQKVLDVAMLSPYASGRKNWTVRIIKDGETILNAAELVQAHCKVLSADVREDMRDSFEAYAENFVAFKTAPVLLVTEFRVMPALSLMLGGSEEVGRWERENFIKSISCVSMLILLAAESLNLGACCMTGPLLAHDGLARLFKIKESREIGAIIALGYKSQEINNG
ncbi:MAG: nitroreductase family protein [Candidatus Riflebacteria bacterium]|nr:nitroreductase family protein [Candidatus Riflebacteria bacterium]